jgi:hypothetical protein
MYSFIALYGFIGDKEDVTKWNASAKISSPLDIIEYLGQFHSGL